MRTSVCKQHWQEAWLIRSCTYMKILVRFFGVIMTIEFSLRIGHVSDTPLRCRGCWTVQLQTTKIWNIGRQRIEFPELYWKSPNRREFQKSWSSNNRKPFRIACAKLPCEVKVNGAVSRGRCIFQERGRDFFRNLCDSTKDWWFDSSVWIMVRKLRFIHR